MSTEVSVQQSIHLPKSRSEDILSEEISDEFVLYDLQRHIAHALNPIAARVWASCDGNTPCTEIARQLAKQYDLGDDVAAAIVDRALQLLDSANLMETVGGSVPSTAISRRSAMRRLAAGGAALLVPIVYSLTAPTPVAASSHCQPFGKPCNNNADCCSGLICLIVTKICF